MMNSEDTTLKDFIHVEKNIITSSVCNYVIEQIENKDWSKHKWYSSVDDKRFSEPDKELDVQSASDDLQNLLLPFIIESGNNYINKYRFPGGKTDTVLQKLSSLRFNRYNPGQEMKQHYDHIHSLFDGTSKGIPVLSFILNFNDTYRGAKLFFWKNCEILLGEGDIVIFPSVFLFPHGVTECISGIRYSAVCWAW